ncbi:reverse transcriptase [Corchorus capsularis]|uniref:Reverse transcriptase n=1 Tax=Corchorus capsularis TaxID=210143 RepID=A0A1R3HHP5_COCAP|nr:reverse transcriptase [Corchorus capsularis]
MYLDLLVHRKLPRRYHNQEPPSLSLPEFPFAVEKEPFGSSSTADLGSGLIFLKRRPNVPRINPNRATFNLRSALSNRRIKLCFGRGMRKSKEVKNGGATEKPLAFQPPPGGQDGVAEMVKALIAQFQQDRQEAKERQTREEARIAALENTLLRANTQPFADAAHRRGERTPTPGDSRDPPNMEELGLPSNEEYYDNDDRRSEEDPTHYPHDTSTDERVYEIDDVPTNSSQADRALRRSVRDQYAGDTYQRLVNKIFKEMIGKCMEVYVDDMLIKSSSMEQHPKDLAECFDYSRAYKMKLNPSKCTFSVEAGKFPGFMVSTEYEALIAGLEIARRMRASHLKVFSDSQIVTKQTSGEYEAKKPSMAEYSKKVQELWSTFDKITLQQVLRDENTRVDALSKLASSNVESARGKVFMEYVEKPAYIRKAQVLTIEEEVAPNWKTEIIDYLNGIRPKLDPKEALARQRRVARYVLIDGVLYKKSFILPLLKCLGPTEANYVLKEIHQGVCGNHMGGRSVAQKALKQGYYWLTMRADAISLVQKCFKCQEFAKVSRFLAEELNVIKAAWSFAMWGMDLIGPLPKASGNLKFAIVAFGLPNAIVSDIGLQLQAQHIQELYKKFHVKLIASSIVYPKTNGHVESTNAKILSPLKKKLESKKVKWIEEFHDVIWAIRTTSHTGTRETPFNMAFSTEAVVLAEIGVKTFRTSPLFDPEKNEEELQTNLDIPEEVREAAQLRQANRAQKISQYYNQRVRHRQFQIGDLVEIPEFDGRGQPDDFLEWLHTVERIFQYQDVPENKQVKLVAIKFRKHASLWWENLRMQRERKGKEKVRTWDKMVRELKKKFLPEDYKQDVFLKLQNLKQGSMSVLDYTAEFDALMIKANINEPEEQTIARYLAGLKILIANIVVLQPYRTLNDVIKLTLRVEKQVKNKSVVKLDERELSEETTPKAPFVPKCNVNGDAKDKGKKAADDSGKTKLRPEKKCFKCHGFGHIASDCPNRQVIALIEGSDDDSEKNELEAEQAHEEEVLVHADQGESLVVQKVLHITQTSPGEDWKRKNVFHTRCTCQGKICMVIIDSGSFENLASMEMVQKLGLKTIPQPTPYKLSWLKDESDLKHVIYDGHAHTYTLKKDGRKITLAPLKPKTTPTPKMENLLSSRGLVPYVHEGTSNFFQPGENDTGVSHMSHEGDSGEEDEFSKASTTPCKHLALMTCHFKWDQGSHVGWKLAPLQVDAYVEASTSHFMTHVNDPPFSM